MMTVPKRDTKSRKSEPEGWQPLLRRLLIAVGVSALLFAALMCIAAALCLKLDMAQQRLGFVAIPLAALSAFAAGYLMVRPIRRQGLVFGMLAAAALYLPVLAAALLMSRGAPGLSAVLTLLAMLFGGSLGGIFAANRSSASQRKSVKHRKR